MQQGGSLGWPGTGRHWCEAGAEGDAVLGQRWCRRLFVLEVELPVCLSLTQVARRVLVRVDGHVQAWEGYVRAGYEPWLVTAGGSRYWYSFLVLLRESSMALVARLAGTAAQLFLDGPWSVAGGIKPGWLAVWPASCDELERQHQVTVFRRIGRLKTVEESSRYLCLDADLGLGDSIVVCARGCTQTCE